MRRLLTLLLAGTLVLAGCGDAEDGTDGAAPEGETPAETPAEPRDGTDEGAGAGTPELSGAVNDRGSTTLDAGELDLTAGDFFFEPTFVAVEGETTLTVQVTNEGDVAHTFTIGDQDIDVTLDPGQSETVELTYGGEGTLTFVCRFHEAQGMQGAFHSG